MKQGNNYSSLLDQFTKIASQEPKKVTFDEQVFEALKATKKPTLKDIIADVAKGKNIHKTAQWDSLTAKPMPEPPMDDSGLDSGFEDPALSEDPALGEDPGLEDSLESNPVEPEGDVETAKQGIAQALVDLCGGPEAACECINSLAGGTDTELPGELGTEEPMGEELGDEMGGMGDEMPPEPMESAAPAPMEMPAPI